MISPLFVANLIVNFVKVKRGPHAEKFTIKFTTKVFLALRNVQIRATIARVLSFPALFVALSFLSGFNARAVLRSLDPNQYHLCSGSEPEWQEFAGKTPHGRRLDVRFTAHSNEAEATLLIRQADVKQDWGIELNGKRIGKLFLMEAPLVSMVPLAPGTLRDGENTLAILPPRENDDIVVGDFRLDEHSGARALEATVEVHVTDAESGASLPCRITLVDERGDLAPLVPKANSHVAARPGVVYTPDGNARLGVLPGHYTLFASRGFEYSLATNALSVLEGQTQSITMRIRREVPTPDLVSSDTHIHSFTYAKHGDATIEERMITLAGEGIELPISTEHNRLIDFAGPAGPLGLLKYFTPVQGCEVTTPFGHFNAFPIASGKPLPDPQLGTWPELIDFIHHKSEAGVIVLNHPRDEHDKFIPFAETNFNNVTGENRRGLEFTFDALELINSGALRSDWRQVYHDWFALLNYGYHITAVAASDSHDVSRFIVGQGRTYIRCPDNNPGTIDINQAINSLRQGRAYISLGLVTQLTIENKFEAGDLATGLRDEIQVSARVLGPAWVTADRLELYANGTLLREKLLQRVNAPEKANIKWTIPRPKHDIYLVALATGPGVKSPHWAIPRPYQPTSKVWEPLVIGSTNPVWLDCDGDGKFTSARGYAHRLLEQNGTAPDKLLPALLGFDEAVAIQSASLCQGAGADVRTLSFKRSLEQAPVPIQRGFAAFARTLPP